MTERPKAPRGNGRGKKPPATGRKQTPPASAAKPSRLARLARMVGLSAALRPVPEEVTGTEIQRIARSGLFDAAFYLAQIDGKPDCGDPPTGLSEDALIGHYLQHGAAAWLNPSRSFDTGLHLQAYPRLAQTGENALLHFIRSAKGTGSTAGAADRPALAGLPRPASRVVARTRRAFVIPATLAARNTTRYRVEHLIELIGEASLTVVDLERPPDDLFAEIERGAIVILQRLAMTSENEELLARIRARAALVAYDIDDQIFDANELEEWRIRGLDHAPGQYARCMALADHFFVSTARLGDKIERRFGQPAHVVTNCLGREIVAHSRAAQASSQDVPGPFVLGYASGSHTHDEDLKIALPAIEAFLRANPDAEFHAIGHMTFPNALRKAFGGRVQHHKAVSWRKLPAKLAGFSVQIIPLVDCPFNRCKSHIRFLEAAAVGVPSIVSAVGEPGTTVIDGVTGLACPDDPALWQHAMQVMHDDAALRHRLAEGAHRLVLADFTTDAPFSRRRTERVFDEIGLLRDAS